MSGVVDRIIQRDLHLSVVPWGSGRYTEFYQSDRQDGSGNNPSGIAIEEGMLLYSLVRCFRPEQVLETGTNLGISARFIGLALEDNRKGNLTTIEHDKTVAKMAWEKLQFYPRVSVAVGKVEDFDTSGKMYDFLWLDTELATRYSELERFWSCIKPGSIICIHDLSDLDMEQFGGVPTMMRDLLNTSALRAVPIPTEHGLTIFQKADSEDHVTDTVYWINKKEENNESTL